MKNKKAEATVAEVKKKDYEKCNNKTYNNHIWFIMHRFSLLS